MRNVYVLTWYYHDKSDFGVIRIFESRAAAEEMRELLVEHASGKVFDILEVGLV